MNHDDAHEDDVPDDDGGGFDVDDWARLKPFVGAVATLEDVQAGRAVFALGDTLDPRPLDMTLPQPLIWWDDDGEQAAVAVQAETHVSPDGETMEVLGLILPDGGSAYYHPNAENEADRQAVNAWIRTSGEYDAVIDFDQALRDPEHPRRMLSIYDNGDHLHPSDDGLVRMGDVIDLALFD